MQHLDGTADFIVAAYHRVQLAHAGALGQINAIFFQRFALVFGIGTVHVLTTAHGVNGGLEGLAGQPVLFNDFADVLLAVGQCQQKQFAGHKLVPAFEGLLFGRLQQRHHVAPNLHLLMPLHLRQLLHCGICGRQQSCDVHARAPQQGIGTVILAQHGHQHVGWLDVLVVVA